MNAIERLELRMKHYKENPYSQSAPKIPRLRKIKPSVFTKQNVLNFIDGYIDVIKGKNQQNVDTVFILNQIKSYVEKLQN